jgi:hypothetical protein
VDIGLKEGFDPLGRSQNGSTPVDISAHDLAFEPDVRSKVNLDVGLLDWNDLKLDFTRQPTLPSIDRLLDGGLCVRSLPFGSVSVIDTHPKAVSHQHRLGVSDGIGGATGLGFRTNEV